ncbi:MAG TPA: SH3 domain-containing protein [Rhabdochlamydiaceae bacterium]|nr:SH3 domain-containing protein [Rhabdochlamydiaceae bacterium]
MSRFLPYVCTTLAALSLSYASADEGYQDDVAEAPTFVRDSTVASNFSDKQPAAKPQEIAIKPFTGKVKGKKVRMRLNAELDSRVIKELNANELLSVVGEKGDFWAVDPPAGTKAYVFRSFVLDNVVEGNRVNVRIEPDLEAPVIGHLNAGDRVQGIVSSLNNKWLEIAPPAQTHFYVAKDYLDNVGGLEVKKQYDKRKTSAEQLLDAASLLSKTELRKPFDEIDLERITHSYNNVIHDYAEFPEYVEKARESLASLQESYIQKKIAYLESKNMASLEGKQGFDSDDAQNQKSSFALTAIDATDRMKLWEPIEESLYLSWARMNEDRTMQDFYEEQKIAAVPLNGILEAYVSPVKNKPGDFILRDKDLPVAYLYSTQINLQHLIGKKISIVGVQRPNNNFAFPAYFVLSVE